MRNKKGFTLVELVIVIAVIAILAGVMIGTFASVVKKAEKSREQQELKQQEIAQKADDVLAKIENADWFGWEDFETSLATKISENTKTTNAELSAAYTAALREALDEYAKKAAESNTALTEAQVKYIIENAISKQGTGATEAQVKAIVNAAISNTSTLTKSQVQALIEASRGYTITEVKAIIDAAFAKNTVPTADEIAEIVKKNTLTEADIKKILEATLAVNKTVTTADEFAAAVSSLNSGSTIVVKGELAAATIELKENKSLTIRGDKIGTLTINAPAATIAVYNDVDTLNVTAAAMNSVHMFGKVGGATVNAGRVVFEAGATVGDVSANPTEASSSVKIEVAKGVTVPAVVVESTAKGNVDVTNNGTIGTITNNSTSNVVSITNNEGSTQPTTAGAGGIIETNDTDSYKIFNGTFDGSGYYKLMSNLIKGTISLSDGGNYVLDLNGYELTNKVNWSFAFVVSNGTKLTIKGGTVAARKGIVTASGADTVVILDGGSYSTSVVASATAIEVHDGAKVVMNGGTVEAINEGAFGVGVYKDSSFVMNGGQITAYYFAVAGNGSVSGSNCGTDTTIVINAGVLQSLNDNVIYHPQRGTLTINGGTLKTTEIGGFAGVEMRGGQLEVNGGIFKTTGTDMSKTLFANGASSVIPSCITIVNTGYYDAANVKVTINAGIFTSGDGLASVGEFVKDENSGERTFTYGGQTFTGVGVKEVETSSGKLVINGGTFSSDVSKYVKDGYTYNKTTQTVEKK